MAKVKILRGVGASGKHLEAGKEYDIKESDAKLLLRMGRAVPVSLPSPIVEDREKDLKVSKKAATKKPGATKKTTTKK